MRKITFFFLMITGFIPFILGFICKHLKTCFESGCIQADKIHNSKDYE